LTEREWAHYYALVVDMDLERDSRKLIRRLEQDGFERIGAKGSHAKYRKGDRTVIVQHPKKRSAAWNCALDLPTGRLVIGGCDALLHWRRA
jgi:predicted RNA binding protein YcfA (HicA-like mRNA interferase family)